MRLQLRHAFSFLLLAAFFLRTGWAWAQSSIKLQRLRYDEGSPGIQVDEEDLEVLLEMENEDRASVDVVHDVITGASPTGLPATATVTGASARAGRNQQYAAFQDERWGFSATYGPKINRITRITGGLIYGYERDFFSRGATLGATFELNKKNTTLEPSLTYLDEDVRPRNENPSRSKFSIDYQFNISQVLNSWNVLTLGAGYGESSGYLADPYKKVQVGSQVLNETRPDYRSRDSARLEWRTKPFERLAFDLSYRYYSDNWGVRSHAAKVVSLNEVGDSWLLELFFRYYRQSAADFWNDQFSPDQKSPYRSSDTRLSGFFAETVGTTVIYKLSDSWWIEGSAARYAQFSSAGGFGGGGVPGESEARRNGAETEGDGGGGGSEEESGVPFVLLNEKGAMLSATVITLAVQYRF